MEKTFIELAKTRYSVRSFDSKKVEKEKIDKILLAGQLAPTACNFQPELIYCLESEEALEKLQKCKASHFGETLALLVCYNKDTCWVREYDNKNSGDIDASIVATSMMMEAWDLGIGSTWIMHFIPEAIKEEFKLPENIIPVCLLVMGYPSKDAKPSSKHAETKNIEELVKHL